MDSSSSRSEKRASLGGLAPVSTAWIRMLFAMAESRSFGQWRALREQGFKRLQEAIYELYNAKTPCDAVGGYSDNIDKACTSQSGRMKTRQGMFVVMMNTSFAFEPDLNCEWRVYLNADLACAPKLFGCVLELFDDPQFRVTQTKIVSKPDEARARSDVIVVYTDSEASARHIARQLAGDGRVTPLLGADCVQLGCYISRGIAIGQSPMARGGDTDAAISFGDLRAAVLALAMLGVCEEVGAGDLAAEDLPDQLTFWLAQLLDDFGLSAQESFRNGNATRQPRNKGELKARIRDWETRIKQMGKFKR